MYDEALFAVIAGMMGFVVILLLVFLAFYILKGVALYKMANKRGIENAWLAFIPIGMDYITGKLIGEVSIGGSFKLDAALGLPIGSVAVGILSAIPFIGWLFAIAYCIYYYMAYYQLYKSYKAESAVMYLVLSILFGFIAIPIILFMIKDLNPVDGEVLVTRGNQN